MSAPEDMPFISLDLAGQEFRATPENATLFTFAAHAILENGVFVMNPESRNHVFLDYGTSDKPDVMTGAYVFQQDIVVRMREAMLQYGFPARLNQRVVPLCDENAYQSFIQQQLDHEAHDLDDFPDWLGNGNS